MNDGNPESELGSLGDSVHFLSQTYDVGVDAIVARNGALFATLRVSDGAVALSVLEERSGQVRLLGVVLEHLSMGDTGSTVLTGSFRRAGRLRRWASAQAALSFIDEGRFAAAVELWSGRGSRAARVVHGDGRVVSLSRV